MNHWTDGYVADIGYTYGYYAELCPTRARMAFHNAGLIYPRVEHACELGFGQGVSINLHAAATPTKWYGNDFNPSQAAQAMELAQASGAKPVLSDEAFDEFCTRADLPDFDFIGLHGIWSWISEENQGVIVDFLRRKLKVGGVLYISYNSQPGWSNFMPMRQLMNEYVRVMSNKGGGIKSQIDGALGFCERLLALHPQYLTANPQVSGKFDKMKGMGRNYLAHEYFNKDWHPMYFNRMAELLGQAKMNFACSAVFYDQIANLNMTPDHAKLLAEISDVSMREMVRDFIVNQQFRRDYWIKGVRPAGLATKQKNAAGMKYVLKTPRDGIALEITSAGGKVSLKENIYAPVLDALADYKPRTLAEIAQKTRTQGLDATQIPEVLTVLAGMNHVTLAQDEAAAEAAVATSRKLNVHLCERSVESGDIGFLASPVTGGGVMVNRFEQLFLQAHQRGLRSASEMARHAWDVLKVQNQRVIKEGKAVQSDEENLAELQRGAEIFLSRHLPMLVGLRIV